MSTIKMSRFLMLWGFVAAILVTINAQDGKVVKSCMQKSEEGNEDKKLVKLIMKLKGRINKDEEIPMEMTWCKEPECKVDLVTSEKASIERKEDGTMALKLLKSKRNRLIVTLNVTSDTD